MAAQARREKFLATLRALGGSAGNRRLRAEIGWVEVTYDHVKQALIEQGAIIPGRGRGGSVALTNAVAVEPAAAPPAAPRAKPARANANGNGGGLNFETQLWATADKLRGNMEPSDYKHVALGLIFLKYISDAFEAKRAELLNEQLADAEDPEEYLAENVFWVPKEARWSHLQARAKQSTIGKDVDDAMLAIEASNASLKPLYPLAQVTLPLAIELRLMVNTGDLEPAIEAEILLGEVQRRVQENTTLGGLAVDLREVGSQARVCGV
jgi:type I restriction enzyme M protein